MPILGNTLSGWIALALNLILAPVENVFPGLAGVFSHMIAGFSKLEAAAITASIKHFGEQISSGATWGAAFADTLTFMGSEEMSVLSEEAKHLVQAFMHRSAKP